MPARPSFFALLASCVVFALPVRIVGAPEPSPAPAATRLPGPAPSALPSGAATPSAPNALGSSTPSRPPAAYDAFMRDAKIQPGVIDLVQKDDELVFDLPPDQRGKTYLIAPVLASAIAGDTSALTGRLFEPLVVRFERVGHRVLWVEPNENYSAPAGSPGAASIAVSAADSVINATPIVAEDDASKRIVIPANYFLTDVENIGRELGGRPGPTILGIGASSRPGYTVDAARSFFERVKALPSNDEILASLGFTGQGADQPLVADGRNIRLRMHYSIVEAPALGGYRPRLADDRVGYFNETQKRIGDERKYPPFVRYIDRRDASAGPFVYYLTDEIPLAYRDTVRSAILAWNDAFARIGLPNQMVVRDAPTDGTFDPDDIRYSTIRWVTGESSGLVAFGASLADPRTGQMLRGQVVIDGDTIARLAQNYDAVARPLENGVARAAASAGCARARCVDDDAEGASSAALGLLALQSRGVPLPERRAYVRGYLRWIVMHEVGHTLGLSHNFVASGLYPLALLHDPAFTAHHQLSASVMDYMPVNLSPKGKPQGAYFQTQIGLYDRWAIRYGYTKLPFVTPEAERPALESIAALGTRPEYRFESDEDAAGSQAIDPRVNVFDLGGDPLAFAQNQFAIDDELLADLDRSLPRGESSYADERAAFATQINDYARSAGIVAKYVGGAYVSRDHRGQPSGQPPIRPIPRDVSERALALLDRHVFSSTALRFSPQLLDDLGYDHFGGWGDQSPRPDFPAVELLARLQDSVMLDHLLAPDTASRLVEAEYRSRTPGESMTLADLFRGLQRDVFDDLGAGVRSTNVVHRNLQRRFAGYLMELVLAPSALVEAVGYPADVPVLARQELIVSAGALERSLRSATLDDATRAHRTDLAQRIRHALDPTFDGAP